MSAEDRQREAEAALREFRRRGLSRDAMLEALCERGFGEYEADWILDGHALSAATSAQDSSVAAPEPWLAAPTIDPGPVGIGGWLILPAIGLVVSPIYLVDAAREIHALLEGELLQQAATAYPEFPFAVKLSLAGILGLLLLNLVAAVLFFTKNHRTPVVMVTLLLARAALPLATETYLFSILGKAVSPAEAIGLILPAGIWVPYFLTSRRVKNTFVHCFFRR